MATINLRELYPVKIIENKEVKNPDCFIEVSDIEAEAFKAGLTEEIADVYFNEQRDENAYQRRVYWYKANYSLDCGDGIENDAINITNDPVFEEYADKLTKQQLFDALNNLPEKQRKRIYAHFFLGMSKAKIARSEKLVENAVKDAIKRGLINMENFLKKNL